MKGGRRGRRQGEIKGNATRRKRGTFARLRMRSGNDKRVICGPVSETT